MEKVLIPVLTLLSILSLAGCSPEEPTGGDEDVSVTNAIVVYFSATNHTEAVAETIADHIGSAIYELEPVDPYTSEDLNYGNSTSRVVQEYEMTQQEQRVDVELVTTDFGGFEDADYVFLGAPVWWRQLSWVIENFVADNDFSNKTIIPFGTSASSGYDLDNLTPLTGDDENVTWLEPQRFRSSVSSDDVIEWVDSLGLTFE